MKKGRGADRGADAYQLGYELSAWIRGGIGRNILTTGVSWGDL